MILLLILLLLIISIYIYFRLKIYFFFYNHQNIMSIMNLFLKGRALTENQYQYLYLIPQSYLYHEIKKNFSKIFLNQEAVDLILHSGFLFHYLNQKTTDCKIITGLWQSHSKIINNFLREIYYLLPYKSQKTILSTLYTMDKSIFFELFYTFICIHPEDSLIHDLGHELGADYTFSCLQQKINQTNFNFVFFYSYPLLNL